MIIQEMRLEDKTEVINMMRTFYASPAVHTNGSEEIFLNDVNECIGESPYAEGFIFYENNEIMGYAMIAKSFSTEFGKRCIWIEDLYIKEQHRGKGIGKDFFNFITDKYSDSIFRLEVDKDNEKAVNLYKKSGFDILPYLEMKK